METGQTKTFEKVIQLWLVRRQETSDEIEADSWFNAHKSLKGTPRIMILPVISQCGRQI